MDRQCAPAILPSGSKRALMSRKILICNRLTSPWQHTPTSEQQRLSGTFLTTDAITETLKTIRFTPSGGLKRPAQRLKVSWAAGLDQMTTVINDSPVGLHVCHARKSFKQTNSAGISLATEAAACQHLYSSGPTSARM